MKEYKFEPAEIVLNICMIYVHLGESKNGEAFCLAVSKDGRSYNHQLFKQAENVLGIVLEGYEECIPIWGFFNLK